MSATAWRCRCGHVLAAVKRESGIVRPTGGDVVFIDHGARQTTLRCRLCGRELVCRGERIDLRPGCGIMGAASG